MYYFFIRMYIFHDGLVRMCTEEYVKPTKQVLNINILYVIIYYIFTLMNVFNFNRIYQWFACT